jgi:AraC-like DNA-binding protein
MNKLDISKEKTAVAEYVDARKGVLTKRDIPYQKPRFSDAFVFIIDGSCKYSFDDGTKFEAKKSDVLYLAKDAVYEMKVNCDRYEFFVVNFNFMSDTPRQSAVYPTASPTYAHQLFSSLCFSRESDTQFSFAKKMGVVYKIIEIVAQSSDRAYVRGSNKEKIELIADKIHLNFSSKQLSVADLASASGFSEVYFRKLFLKRFGITPSKYIIQTRISHAIKLMAFDALTLEDISDECGFSSLPYFSKLFKSIVGESPAVYRRSLGNTKQIIT